MDVQVNLWAVFLAMASSMVVGSIWYAQGVFGKTWAKLAKINLSKNKDANAAGPIIITTVVSLVTAYVLAHLTFIANHFFDQSFLTSALTTAFWVWAGFTAARFMTHDAFESRPFKLTFLNIAHEFVTLMLMGLVIGLMGV